MKFIYLLLVTLLFTGCELFDSNDLKIKKLEAQIQKDMAQINLKKELANIDKSKELEKVRLKSTLDKESFEHKMKLKEQENEMKLNIYISLIIALLIIVLSSFIYYFFKIRHENELHQYKDNLEKYFHQQENETRLKVAEKLIDAVASGKLDKEQKRELLHAFNGQMEQESSEIRKISLIKE